MSSLRRSQRKPVSNSSSVKDEMIIIIKSHEDGEPAEQITDVKTSIIQYMCNKCNKKYTTTVGLKRHLKFCNDSSNEINLKIPKSNKENVTMHDIHNDLNSRNLNLLLSESTQDSGNVSADESLNNQRIESNGDSGNTSTDEPGDATMKDSIYEFNEDNDNPGDNQLPEEDPDICQCCGENKETAHRHAIYNCEVCNKHYKLKNSFTLHMTKFHSTKKNSINCKQCSVRCVDTAAMLEHMTVHTEEKNFCCTKCNKKFSRKYNLDRHLQLACNDKEKPNLYTCQACGNGFTRKDNLLVHLRMHLGKTTTKRIFQCNYCKEKFKGKPLLKVHLMMHNGEAPYSCALCKRTFKSKGALVKHKRTHSGEKPFGCPECDKYFSAKETLNRHMLIHTSEKPFPCLLCGKSFIQYMQLQAHMYHHTGLNYFKCQMCNLSFNVRSKLTTHIKFVHEGAKMLECTYPDCDKKFTKKDALLRHSIVHTNEKPFTCDTCNKKFKTRVLLIYHTKTHRREKPQSCPLCNRCFIRADCLIRHLRHRHKETYQTTFNEAKQAKLDMMRSMLQQQFTNVAKAKTDCAAGELTREVLTRILDGTPELKIENLKSKLQIKKEKYVAKKKSVFKNSQVMDQDILNTTEDVEVEIVDIPLTEQHLATCIQELLDLLIDKESFDAFSLCDQSIDDILEGLIIKCGHIPASPDIINRAERLRENAKLLLTVVIDDTTMKSLFETQTVDEVILNVLRLGKQL